MDGIRARHFEIILYPKEDEKHKEILEFIRKSYSFLAIEHDKDVTDEGELKKPHYHVIVSFKNARYLNGFADEVGIAPNYIEVKNDLDKALLYCIHFGNKDKFQYDVNNAEGELKKRLIAIISKSDEAEQVKQIIDLLYSLPKPVTYTQLLLACCDAGLYSAFRRLGYGIKMLLDESKIIERSLTE